MHIKGEQSSNHPNGESSSPLGALSRPNDGHLDDAEADAEELEALHDDDEGYEGDTYEEESYSPPPRRTRRATTPPRSVSSNGPLVIFGSLIAVAGVVAVAACAANAEVRQVLQNTGVQPLSIVVLGVVLLMVGKLARRVEHQQRTVAALFDAVENTASHAQEALDTLLEAEHQRANGSASGDELQQALHFIQRQEEKISNLSKATKMYGKPLLEITNQLTESGRQIGDIESKLVALKTIVEQSSSRLEGAVRESGSRPAGGQASAMPDEGLRHIEAMLRDLAQRLVSNGDEMSAEIRESMRRSLKAVEELREELPAEIGKETAKLSATVAQVDQSVAQTRDAIVNELHELGQALDQHATASGSGSDPVAAGVLQSIRTEIGALTESIANLRLRAAADGEGHGDADQAASGGNAGKNVQGAIAKLKKMRK